MSHLRAWVLLMFLFGAAPILMMVIIHIFAPDLLLIDITPESDVASSP